MPVTPNSIITPQSIRTSTCALAAANSTFTDAPTNSALLYTAGANGSRITRIGVIPRATATASVVQLYRSTDGGTTKRLFDSIYVPGVTVGASSQFGPSYFTYSESYPLLLAANEQLHVAQGVANNVVVFAEGADY